MSDNSEYMKIWRKKHRNYLREWRKKHPGYSREKQKARRERKGATIGADWNLMLGVHVRVNLMEWFCKPI